MHRGQWRFRPRLRSKTGPRPWIAAKLTQGPTINDREDTVKFTKIGAAAVFATSLGIGMGMVPVQMEPAAAAAMKPI